MSAHHKSGLEAEVPERHSMYVARNLASGQYSAGHLRVLEGAKHWLSNATPSVAQVQAEFAAIDAVRPLWATDLNQAEPWSAYSVTQYGRFLPDAEFVPIYIGTKPL